MKSGLTTGSNPDNQRARVGADLLDTRLVLAEARQKALCDCPEVEVTNTAPPPDGQGSYLSLLVTLPFRRST
jgi:hypothetical protein